MLEQLYENYTFSKDELSSRAGLLSVPIEKFTKVIDGFVLSSSINNSIIVNLGIEFPGEELSGVKYTRAAISFSGVVVLIDPNSVVTTPQDAFDHVCLDINDNTSIKSTFTQESLLLCPWWDPTQITVATNPYSLQSLIFPTIFTYQKYGFIPFEELSPPLHMQDDGGVLFAHCVETVNGKCSIIKWCTLETNDPYSRLLRYELALYENGNIEFRYSTPQQKNTSDTNGNAVVGIFMPNSSNRFRDLSNKDERGMYKWGGFTYKSTYSDPNFTTPYYASNNGRENWPGWLSGKSTYSFIKPHPIRDLLPRQEIKLEQAPDYTSLFVSRRAIPALTGAVDSPIALSYLDIDSDGGNKTGLFNGELVALRNRNINDVSRFTQPTINLKPFNDEIIDDPTFMFASASSIDTSIPNFTTRLQSREIITIEKQINNSVKFLPEISTVVQFSDAGKQFVYCAPERLKNPNLEIKRAAEDCLGFNALGYWVASGTTSALSQSQSTFSPGLYNNNSSATDIDMLGSYYKSSMSLNDSYVNFTEMSVTFSKSLYEPIKLNIDRPFVVEAIEINLPVVANDDWFKQLSKICVNEPSSSYSGWNLGGPGVTISVQVDRGSKLRKFRDIVATGSFTHITDAQTSSWSITPLGAGNALVTPVGFKTCGGDFCGVVNAISGNFTGSVTLRMPVMASVGSYMAVTGSTTKQKFLETLAINNTIPKRQQAWNWANSIPVHLTPYGRSHDGTSISARSVVVRETTLDNNIYNRFSFTGSAFTQLEADLASYTNITYAGAGINVTNKPSPYVLFPGDGLRLFASHCRSAFTGSFSNYSVPNIDSETGPIVGISSGKLRIRLIGRYLKNGNLIEGHKSETQTKIYGDDVVLDQLEFFSQEDLYGTTLDHYITGTYTRLDQNFNTVPYNNRAVLFNKTNSSASQTFDTQLYSIALTKPREYAGFSNINISNCESERYYDSMLPPIDRIVRADGAKVLYQSSAFYIVNRPTAVVFFDIPLEHTSSMSPYSDNIWSRAFPYESRYNDIERYVDATKLYVSDVKLVGGTLGNVESTGSNAVSSDLIAVTLQHRRERETATVPVQANLYYFYALDAIGNNRPKVVTAPITNTFQTKNDLIKTLYGIGDINSIVITGSSPPMGSTCAVDYASISTDPPSSKQYSFGTKPIIRGWKYGIVNGLPQYSRAIWRRNKFGQLRDMLEQRIDSKFASIDSNVTVGESPVRITFLDSFSKLIIDATNTTSSNLSYEASSSLPYFDGIVRNR